MRVLVICFLLFAANVLAAQVDEFNKELSYKGQKLKIDAELVNGILLKQSSDNQFRAKVTYNLNEGQLNEAVEIELKDEGDRIRLEVGLNEKAIKSQNFSDCKEKDASWWGDEWGGRVCADIQVEIEIPNGAKIDIESVLADVVLQGQYEEVDVKTVTGNIDLNWPEEKGFFLEMKTVNGSIYTNYDLKAKGDKGLPMVSAHEFDAKWGDGKYFVRLETVTSDIYFRRD